MKTARLAVLCTTLTLCAHAAHADNLSIFGIDVQMKAQTVSLGVLLRFDDPDQQISRALLRGPVWLELQVLLYEESPWWGGQPTQIGAGKATYQILYDALDQRYLVHRIPGQEVRDFPTLAEVLEYLSQPSAVPVVRRDLLEKNPKGYLGEVRARMFANSFPLVPYNRLTWNSAPVQWKIP